MAGLVPAFHVFGAKRKKDVDARHKAGHDESRAKDYLRLPQKRWMRLQASSRSEVFVA